MFSFNYLFDYFTGPSDSTCSFLKEPSKYPARIPVTLHTRKSGVNKYHTIDIAAIVVSTQEEQKIFPFFNIITTFITPTAAATTTRNIPAGISSPVFPNIASAVIANIISTKPVPRE